MVSKPIPKGDLEENFCGMSRGNSEAKQKGFESTSIRDNFDTEVEDGTLNTKVVNVI